MLVVEDNWFLADELMQMLQKAGVDVLGPVGSVAEALALIEATAAEELGAAVLDVDLQGEVVTPVAEALALRGVPFMYATGYSEGAGPKLRHGAPWLVKPVDLKSLISMLTAMSPAARGDDDAAHAHLDRNRPLDHASRR